VLETLRNQSPDAVLLEHGFARVRCAACGAEFLVAFRCKGRHFCPSCHARRLAEWSRWLDERLLAPVAHRQVVLTLPRRLRPYFLHDRRRLGLLSREAARTLRAYVRAVVGEGAVVRGLIVRADVRLGGAPPSVPLPEPDAAVLARAGGAGRHACKFLPHAATSGTARP
jgi:hypothetical protein